MQSSSCAICISLLDRNDDIFSTVCGHVFHMPCLTQWLERSKNCPQCREKLSNNKIFRLYFNFNANDSIKEDAGALQLRVDSMQFQLDLKDASINENQRKYHEMKKQRDLLRAEVLKCENELTKKDSAIFALKEQAKYLRIEAEEKNVIAAKFESLKSKIDEYKAVQKLLSSTANAADELVASTNDASKLGVYVSVLKRQLESEVQRRKELRDVIKDLKEDMKNMSQEKNQLEAAKTGLEIEIDALEEQNKRLRQKLEKNPQTGLEGNEAEGERNSRSEFPALKRKKLNHSPKVAPSTDSNDEENDPLVHMHSFKVTSAKDHCSNLRTKELPSSSILKKKQRLTATATTRLPKPDDRYVPDGLGGYMKIEQFPVTRQASKSNSPRKGSLKRKVDDSKNRKIDSYIDLT
ncbi:E3 ubiquitin-protein ligase TRAIP [Diachasma alloeum]|uniref:E3 ubiquitin-protein ligase TRAIP n=1 Tax=Diachasma alloeum TaxID=454923 RepID=UPI0007384B27|nr:E3 ubiquitin-protein ligase TRAIP [Diachasma alloeum]